MLIVIAYDITDDKIRERVSSKLMNHGMRVQKSLFECYLNHEQFKRLKSSLEALIDLNNDHIRFYHICKKDQDRIEIEGVRTIYRDEDYFMI